MEESDLERIKSIVSLTVYNKMEVEPERTIYLEKLFDNKEKEEYMKLLKEFSDVIIWVPFDLRRIPPKLKELHINLVKGVFLIWQ